LSELIAPGLFNSAEEKSVRHQRITKVHIKGAGPLNYVIDGETYQDDELFIEVNPASLTMLIAPEV